MKGRASAALVTIALLGMATSAAMVLSSLFVPMVGLIVATFAPDVFLASVVLLLAGLAAMVMRPAFVVLLLVPIVVVAGLNTRLPSFVGDWLDKDRVQREIGPGLNVRPGAPIHVVADPPDLTSRDIPWGSAEPRCDVNVICMVTRGFQSQRAYWHENVFELAKGKGFSIARPEEAAPRLVASQVREGRSSTIALELFDEQGKVVSRYRARHREGFPLETPDHQVSDTPFSRMFVEYLLHANSLNRFALAFVAVPRYPVKAFLGAAVKVEGDQRYLPGHSFDPSAAQGPEPPATVSTLEVLEENNYDPARRIDQATWDAMTFDKAADKACRAHLKNEVRGVASWMLFLDDPTGRRKVAHGRPLCSGDSIWLAERDQANNHIALNKYSYAGELRYRVDFPIPSEPSPYSGNVLWPTFEARDGYLYFEWWSTHRPGVDYLARRTLKLRVKEPAANPAPAQ